MDPHETALNIDGIGVGQFDSADQVRLSPRLVAAKFDSMPPKRTSRQPELLVTLVRGDTNPLHTQIERAMREAVRSGRHAPGAPVPSTELSPETSASLAA